MTGDQKSNRSTLKEDAEELGSRKPERSLKNSNQPTTLINSGNDSRPNEGEFFLGHNIIRLPRNLT